MDRDSKMSFCPEDYIIYVNKYTCKNLQLRNKTGKTKAVLRHEIEHVKQIWDIIRLKSAETIIEKLDIQSKKRLNFFKQIEKALGPLPNNPKKINRVNKYYTSLLNYPNMQNQYDSILDFRIIKDTFKYYTNTLEIDAQKAERKYKPSWFKILKTYLKQILCNNN